MIASPTLVAERDAKLRAMGPRPPWWRPFARRRWRRRHAEIMAMDVSQYAEFLRHQYPAERVDELARRRAARDVAKAIRKATGQ